MNARSLLGPADVTDEGLATIVANQHGVDPMAVTIVDSRADPVPYDLVSITTAGRFWVAGTARINGQLVPFRYFVKHVQSWSRSPLFAQVPDPHRAMAEASVPWRTEPLLYRSDLADRLLAGLTMARAYAVHDLDELSAAIWLEDVIPVPRDWSVGDLAHAARLLGRLAANPRVRELASIGESDQRLDVRSYVFGRLSMQIFPLLREEDTWVHPLVAVHFARLRPRLLAAADQVMEFLAEIEQVPAGTAHGDACTNNLLVRVDGTDLVLIDFGFWSTQPLGFDLGQLLIGDVQIGRRAAASLGEVENACLPAYVDGLRAEGCDLSHTPPSDVGTLSRCSFIPVCRRSRSSTSMPTRLRSCTRSAQSGR